MVSGLQSATIAVALLLPVALAVAAAVRRFPRDEIYLRAAAAWLALLLVPVLAGAGLSTAGWVGSSLAWAVALAASAAAIGALALRLRCTASPTGVTEAGRDDGPALRLHGVTAVVVGAAGVAWLASLVVLPVSTPWQIDSLTYHMPRIVHAWQAGTFDFGCTAFWAQWMHPWGVSAWQLWWLQIVGFHDQYLPILSVVATAVGAAMVAGITGELGGNRVQRLLAAGLYLASPPVLLHGVTVMPEPATTACLLAAAYLGVAAVVRGDSHLAALSVLSWALAATMKAFALMSLPLALALWGGAVVSARRTTAQSNVPVARPLVVACALSIGLTLSTGYGANLTRYGHPLGSAQVRADHTFVAGSGGRSVEALQVNAVRFALEWFTPDGLPLGEEGEARLARLGNRLEESLGSPIVGQAHARHMFRVARTITPRAQEDLAWPGVLAWWITAAGLFWFVSGRRRAEGWLLAGVVGWLLLQLVSGPWDPWRGRYMGWTAGLGAVVIALQAPRLVRSSLGWLAGGVLAGLVGLAAIHVAVAREGRPLLAGIQRDGYGEPVPWPWEIDRIGQLASQKPWIGDAARAVERVLPEGAGVALVLHERQAADYVFMGPPSEHRPVYWPWCSETRMLELPPGATHLIYELGSIEPRSGDIRVRRNVILRVLDVRLP